MRVMSKRIRRRRTLQISDKHQTSDSPFKLISIALALLMVIMLAYWSTITDLFVEWQENDDYSAGQLVPLIAIFLTWRERQKIKKCSLTPCWWAVMIIILAQIARIFGLLFMFESAERYALVLTITGIILMIAGWKTFRVVSWIVLFLFLMVPLLSFKLSTNVSLDPFMTFSVGSAILLLAYSLVLKQNAVFSFSKMITV